MVDIGDDVGALLVHVDAARIGQELHVRRPGETRTTHTGIWERRIGSRAVVVAVFPALVEGGYAILDRDGSPCATSTSPVARSPSSRLLGPLVGEPLGFRW